MINFFFAGKQPSASSTVWHFHNVNNVNSVVDEKIPFVFF